MVSDSLFLADTVVSAGKLHDRRLLVYRLCKFNLFSSFVL